MSQKLTQCAVVLGTLFVVACAAGDDGDDSAVSPITIDDGLTAKSCMYYPGGTVCTSTGTCSNAACTTTSVGCTCDALGGGGKYYSYKCMNGWCFGNGTGGPQGATCSSQSAMKAAFASLTGCH
jgi:hypothetical protein